VWSFKKYEIDKLKKASDDFVLTVTFEESADHQFKTGGLAAAGKRDSQVFDKNTVQAAVNNTNQSADKPEAKYASCLCLHFFFRFSLFLWFVYGLFYVVFRMLDRF
jgi:hypothetical protein